MKLLILIVAIMLAAGGALHSWQTREQFIQASLLSEAFSLSAQPKLRVADYYVANGVMPHDNETAGLPPAKRLYGTSVKRLSVNRGGVLMVDFAERIGEQAMTFTPSVSVVSGLLSWQCASDSIEPSILSKLEPGCSYLPATPESHLMNAIANRDRATVMALLGDGVQVDRVVNGNTPLMLAAKSADPVIVGALLDAGAPVDNATLDAERRTPLMVAIAGNHADIASVLLARGASITRTDFRGKSVTDHARESDERFGGTRYTLMVSAGFNPRFAGREAGDASRIPTAEQTRLHLQSLYDQLRQAALDCHVKRLASLFQQEDDLASPELVQGTLLATHIRKPDCRNLLTSHLGDKPSYRLARDARFAAAVQECDARGSEQLLRENDAISAFDRFEGRSHLDRAVTAGCTSVVSLFLRERGIAGRVPDGILLNALRNSPQRNLVPLVGALIAAGANVNHHDEQGETPLGLAIGLEQPVVAKVLMDAGSDINARTVDGSTPLIEAAKKGYEHLVQQLIIEGAELDARDALGRTALLAAVASAHQRLADLLIRAGANTRLRDRNGIDALLLADTRNLRGIRSLLTTASSDY